MLQISTFENLNLGHGKWSHETRSIKMIINYQENVYNCLKILSVCSEMFNAHENTLYY